MFVLKHKTQICRAIKTTRYFSTTPPNLKGNYYELLGVDKDADKEKIREAYKDLGNYLVLFNLSARKFHPDISKGNEEFFQNLTNAYQTLIDDEKRTQYDNDNIYTDAYFKKKIFGVEVDARRIFWGLILTYGGYYGYNYYQKHFVPKCPLGHEQRIASTNMEKNSITSNT